MNHDQRPSQQSAMSPNNPQQFEQPMPSIGAYERSTAIPAQPIQQGQQPQPVYSPQQPPLQGAYYPQVPSITIVNQNSANATADAQAIAQAVAPVHVKKDLDYSPLVHGLYFFFVGWWLGFYWALFALCMCATVICMPLGLRMLKMLPKVVLLHHE